MASFVAVALSAALVSPIAPFAPSDTTPEQRVAPATSVLSTLRAADPQRGQPAWTLRLARSETGLQCSTVGQVRDEAFGLVGLDGAFRAIPEANADACAEPGTLLGARVFAAARSADVRTVVYGVAGAGVKRVTVTVAGGRPEVVPSTAEGAFAAVLRRYPEDAQPVVAIERTDGTTRTEAFAGGNGVVVADPFGGRAWRLTAFGFGTPRQAKPPRLQTICVNFSTARAVPGEPNASSPPVCGLQPGRPGVKRRTLFFTTRRLSGAGPSGDFLAGNWNHHPPRVAVWGLAREAKRIVVRAGSLRVAVTPRLNGGFLALLPSATRTGSVTVQVDGRRFGPSFGTVARPQPPRGSASASAIPISDVAPGRLADGRYAPGWVQYRVTRSKLAVTLDDPAGGLPWVLKRFDADRVVVNRPTRSLAKAKRIGRSTCVQLGRLQGAAFGWVYADGRFRRAGTEYPLLQCTALKHPAPVVKLASTLGLGDPAVPQVTGSVVWGLMPGATAVSVTGSGGADGAAKVAGGAFLRIGGPGAHPAAASVSGGGRTVRLGARRGLPSGIAKRLKFPTLVAGTETIEAPAPDPAGGPHWGMWAARTQEGVPCAAGPTRVVGDRGGEVDLRVGLFEEGSLSAQSCRPLETKPTAKRPCDIGWSGGNAEELEGQEAFLAQARAQRRLLAGRTSLYAVCGADVERVTLRTPRDVRTLVPSAVGHAILAVFDGDFVGGEFVVTAHLQGGGTWTERQSLGF
jgi:hypothetical protein